MVLLKNAKIYLFLCLCWRSTIHFEKSHNCWLRTAHFLMKAFHKVCDSVFKIHFSMNKIIHTFNAYNTILWQNLQIFMNRHFFDRTLGKNVREICTHLQRRDMLSKYKKCSRQFSKVFYYLQLHYIHAYSILPVTMVFFFLVNTNEGVGVFFNELVDI